MDLLPTLRHDIQIYPGPADWRGAPSWTIYDPVTNRYIRIGPIAFEILRFWESENIADLQNQVEHSTGRKPQTSEIEWLIDFLAKHELLVVKGRAGAEQLEKRKLAQKNVWYKNLLKQYLFFKIPVLRPGSFLQRTQQKVDLFYSPVFYVVLSIFGILGVFLLVRQWDEFLSATPSVFSWQGASTVFGAIVFSKLCHEFAHAYTAIRLKCRVPTMGVAFMVMWPVLYTELSDTSRLTRRQDRLKVACAGMVVELILAVCATFLWGILSDGIVRDAMLTLATVTWVMTLGINLNPFMRFDGYYIFADALGIENLQDRAFALGKFNLRKSLFGIVVDTVEEFSPKLNLTLTLYAYFTWIYRFFLFVGIALLVYHMFFKVLGIFLFIVEIWWFIGRPILNEVKVWWKMRDKIQHGKPVIRSLIIVGLIMAGLLYPWQRAVHAPALMLSSHLQQVFIPESAKVIQLNLKDGQKVEAGEVLVQLTSPDLNFKIAQSRSQLAIKQNQLEKLSLNPQSNNNRLVLITELGEEKTKLQSLLALQEKLTIKAPLTGEVRTLDDSLREQRWLKKGDILAQVIDPNQTEVIAYVRESDYSRISKASSAVFIPENLSLPREELTIQNIALINVKYVEHPALIDAFGGSLQAIPSQSGNFTPTEGIFRVAFTRKFPSLGPRQLTVGQVQIDATPRNLISTFARKAWAVFIRESGM